MAWGATVLTTSLCGTKRLLGRLFIPLIAGDCHDPCEPQTPLLARARRTRGRQTIRTTFFRGRTWPRRGDHRASDPTKSNSCGRSQRALSAPGSRKSGSHAHSPLEDGFEPSVPLMGAAILSFGEKTRGLVEVARTLVARTERPLLLRRNRGFESTSLQQRIRCKRFTPSA
jgi:hypothetical protein